MSDYNTGAYMGEKPSERSRWTPLTRMLLSGEMTQEKQQELSKAARFGRWMINEGYRRVYVLLPWHVVVVAGSLLTWSA
jgi:NADPH oxidase 2